MRSAEACNAIFFDVDGVVVHPGSTSRRSNLPWFSDASADLCFDFSALSDRFFRAGPDSPSLMAVCSLGQADVAVLLSPVLTNLGYRGTVEDFLTYWFEHDAYVDRALLDLIAELREARGYRCYLATNQEHRRASYLWNVLGLSNHFCGMYYSARVGHSKKSPEFYRVVGQDFEFARRPVFFDDRESLVKIASAAGWDAYLYESIDSLRRHPNL